jgi:propanediol utilization protein
MERQVPVGISSRHVHLTQNDLETLFGKGYELHPMKDLSQPGQYASEEQVNLVGPKGRINKVRVLGPIRKYTQVEISRTDSFVLGVTPPIRDSGDLEGTPGIVIEGPKGTLEIPSGVICAQRHLHLSPAEAEQLGLKDKEYISVRANGDRALVFERVFTRVHPQFAMDLHIDTDEANAACLKNGDKVTIID